MKIRRTDDPDICFMESDAIQLWSLGIVEWRIDTHDMKFIIAPIMRDGSEGPIADVTEAWEDV